MRDLRPYGLNPKSLMLYYAEQLPYRVTVNNQRCRLGMKAWSEHLEGRIRILVLPLYKASALATREKKSTEEPFTNAGISGSHSMPYSLNLLCAYRIATKSIPANGSINQLQLHMQS